MGVYYTLWHLETGNAIGGWDSLREACENVLAEIATNDDEDRIFLDVEFVPGGVE